MTRQELEEVGLECLEIVRKMSPFRTGNLRYNAIKYEMPDEHTFKIYVSEDIAPYMIYTNEPWLRGKNPNEGWFDRAARAVAELLSQKLGGNISL